MRKPPTDPEELFTFLLELAVDKYEIRWVTGHQPREEEQDTALVECPMCDNVVTFKLVCDKGFPHDPWCLHTKLKERTEHGHRSTRK